jgi:probable F420-dependent oxidoreductase
LTKHRPFEFGVMASAATLTELTELARKTEGLGYHAIGISDHLDLSGAHVARMAAIPALAAAAVVTTKLRIGTTVINQDFHLAAVLAREAVTLDILSEGRFMLGIGAGHTEYENGWAGIPFQSAGIRVSRFEEYVQAVKAVLGAADTARFDGDYISIGDMPGAPRSVQQPHPPIMIGGTRRRMLSIAAREADIVSINLYEQGIGKDADSLDERVGWLRSAAGTRFEDLVLHLPLGIVVVERGDRLGLVARVRTESSARGASPLAGMSDEQVLSAPTALIGDAGQIADDLERWRERWGVSSFHVLSHMIDEFAPVVQRLAGR